MRPHRGCNAGRDPFYFQFQGFRAGGLFPPAQKPFHEVKNGSGNGPKTTNPMAITKRKYHYEWAAYTDNGKGCFIIERERVYDN